MPPKDQYPVSVPAAIPYRVVVLFADPLGLCQPQDSPGRKVFTLSAMKSFEEAMGEASVFAASVAETLSCRIDGIQVCLDEDTDRIIDWPLPDAATVRDANMKRFVVAWEPVDEAHLSLGAPLDFFEINLPHVGVDTARQRAVEFAECLSNLGIGRVLYIHGYCFNQWHALDPFGRLPPQPGSGS